MKRPLSVLPLLAFGMLAMLVSARAVPNIGNFVWSDLNDNGAQDAGEPGLANVTVQLWNAAKNDLITSTTTNANGNYLVTAPAAGSYRVRVLLPLSTYSFSPKDAAAGNDSSDSDINPTGSDLGFTDILTYSVGVASVANVDAGIHVPQPVNIGNLVWSDLNNNGAQDAGEPGLASVSVQLWNAAKNDFIASTTTNVNGNYLITAPSAGSYRVRVLLPVATYTFSPKDAAAGNDSSDSDINPAGTDFGFTDILTLSAGVTSVTSVDAGIYIPQPANIGNFIWSDDDADGVQDPGEPGIPGVFVQLWNAAKNDLIDSTTTNAVGGYTLTAAQPGGSYRVRVLLPTAADRFTVKDTAAATDSADSDINATGIDSGFTDAFDPAPATPVLNTIDAGLLLESFPGDTIGNRIFQALASGLQPASADIISLNVKIELLNAAGAVLQTTTPRRLGGTNGYYGFAAPPGTYRLRFTALDTDYIPTPFPNAGSDDADSDIDAGGYTGLFALTAGAPRRNLDAGFVRVVHIGNFVWHDQDSDGIQDPSEPGVPNVALELWDAGKTRRWDSTFTNPAGNYTLTAPGPGSYRVWVLRPMPGDSFSPVNAGTATVDSDILSTAADFGFSAPINIASNSSSVVSYDAGLIYSTAGRQVTPFRITAFSREQARLTFSGPVGGTYQVERSSSLNLWTNIGAPVVTSTQNLAVTLSALDLAETENFWRVRRTR